jgi:hypothetical protein
MEIAEWLSAIVGYLFTGFSLQHFGITNTLYAGISIGILSIFILHFSNKPVVRNECSK